MTQRYDSYGSSDSGGEQGDDTEIRFDTYAAIYGTLESVFGTASEFGQSLGVKFSDVAIEDGALYKDTDKGYYKLFSWSSVAGLDPEEMLERGDDPSVDDAPEVERRSYTFGDKQYELVAARVPEITDDDGSVIVEPEAKRRTVDVDPESETVTTGDWEMLGGERPEVGATITWYDGSDEYGPSASSKRLASLLTDYGENAVLDEDDIHNWLIDDSGENIIRDDLQGRRVKFVTVQRESESGYGYNYPVVEDQKTGEEVVPSHWNAPDDGTDSTAEPDSVSEAREQDAGSYPEPIADYLRSGENLDLTRDRAEALLDDLISDTDNAMTEDMVAEHGGRDELVEQVV